MDIYKVHPGGKEELLMSGASRTEIDDLREWLSYTKPLGPGVKLVVRQSTEVLYWMTTAGTEVDPVNRQAPRAA